MSLITMLMEVHPNAYCFLIRSNLEKSAEETTGGYRDRFYFKSNFVVCGQIALH